MTEKYSIADVLADSSHDMYVPVKNFVADLESGKISLCGCLGAMYGEPYCPCQMEQNGLGEQMKNNPLRIEADKKADEMWDRFMAKGGFSRFEDK